MRPATIILTAGHSNGRPGAASPDGQYREELLALELRDRTADLLRGHGYTVLTDGANGVNLPLREAIRLAHNHVGPELELHFNASTATATGVEAFALPTQAAFARDVAISVARVLGLKVRGDHGYKAPNESQHSQLGICNAGAVLLEVCFISNAGDMQRYVQNVEAVSEAIARTLARWAVGQAAAPAVTAKAPARPMVNPPSQDPPATLPGLAETNWQTTLPQQGQPIASALLRSDSVKALKNFRWGFASAWLSALAAWWQSVDARTIFLALIAFLGVLFVLYQVRQLVLGYLRERETLRKGGY
jgi:hypothetical protein